MSCVVGRPDSADRRAYNDMGTWNVTVWAEASQNLFSADECKQFVKFIDGLPLELTPPKKRGEAERVNRKRGNRHSCISLFLIPRRPPTDRISVTSPDFAARLFDVIGPHLPNFPYPASVATKARAAARAGHSLNSNIRMYKYTPNQHFGPHYDDAVVDPSGNGSRSEWTLLVYLTGAEDGVQGGETVFYLDKKMKKQVKAPLNRGSALLHRYEYFRSSQPPILVLTHLIWQQTWIRVFASRRLKGGKWYEVYPTFRCYVCKLISRAIFRGCRDEFQTWEFRQVLTFATPSSWMECTNLCRRRFRNTVS